MNRDRKTPWLALAALSLITAYGLWQIAIRQPDPIQVRIIDLPHVTQAALLTSGIDRQTLSEYLEQTSVEVPYGPVTAYASQLPTLATRHSALATQQEVTPALGRIKPAMTQISSFKEARERNDGHSRAKRQALKVTVTATPKGWIPVEISVYSAKYHNGRTATGERYDHYAGFTAATTRRANGWDLPRGSTWEVSYRGKTVTVRVNDCGSHRPRKASVWLDLSGAAWRKVAGSPSRHVARMRRVK